MLCRLFEIAPQLIELFPFQDEELSEENELLKKHANQVMESIGTCIELISDPEELQETLIGLEIVHHIQNVQVKSFAVSELAPSTSCPHNYIYLTFHIVFLRWVW